MDNDGDAITKSNNINHQIGRTLKKMGYSTKTTSALITMGRINSDLIKKSKSMLEKHVSHKVQPIGLVGSADFNLTLVNRMEPTASKRDLKKEIAYGMGKISVGWHRDSGLKDFSTIAVYQTLQGSSSSSKKASDSWGVALRAMDGGSGGPLSSVPALMVPLPSGSLYYMLDDFNHNHEHAVIAGADGIRYSSTHRVAREGQGTWQYIRDKIQSFFDVASKFNLSEGTFVVRDVSSKKAKEKLVTHVRALQNLMTEIEFEWLRQWYVQGRKHAALHPYWHKPVEVLCNSFLKLEQRSAEVIALLWKASTDSGESHVSENLFDVVIELIAERSKQRSAWKERYLDPIFGELPEDERPFACSCLDRVGNANIDELISNAACMPENLDLLISKLREYRSSFVGCELPSADGEPKANKAKKRKASSTSGSLTRKEQKRVASNWERLKSKIGK